MASIRWTDDARRDLRELVVYISRDSAAYAAAVARRIAAAIERLRRYPRLGRVVPEYEDETVRELIVGNYRVMYRVRGQQVSIIALSHGSRDLLKRLGPEPWDFR